MLQTDLHHSPLGYKVTDHPSPSQPPHSTPAPLPIP
jgi:hypothetical protein